MRQIRALLHCAPLVCGICLAVPLAHAQGGVSLYGGYAASDSLEDARTGAAIDVRSSAAFGAALDLALDPSRELQLYYGQQSTKLAAGGLLGDIDMKLRYLHLGGSYYFDGPAGRGPYVVGGLGATQLSPAGPGLSAEWKPSLNVGFGYLWPLGQHLALRAELRGFFTWLNGSSGLFCSGGCVLVVRGDSFMQGSAMLGISGRF